MILKVSKSCGFINKIQIRYLMFYRQSGHLKKKSIFSILKQIINQLFWFYADPASI